MASVYVEGYEEETPALVNEFHKTLNKSRKDMASQVLNVLMPKAPSAKGSAPSAAAKKAKRSRKK